MRILHIHTCLAGGGIEAILCGLVNQMVNTNNVTVATIFAPKETDVFEKKLSKSVERISLGKVKPGFSISEIFKIYNLIKKGNYDIVHIHGFFYYYALSVLLLHRKVKFFYTIHSDAVMENSPWDKRIFRIKRYCFKKKYIHPITISEASQTSFSNLYKTKSTLIHNGVAQPTIDIKNNPIKQHKITPYTKIFVHAGRINKAKNQVVLCQAFEKLIIEGKDVVLLIAGGNNDHNIMEQLKPFFSERIKYIGERSDIPSLFYFADAMCLPSIWEGLPVTLLESLSVGCIPICSAVGGIVNVVKDGFNGFLSSDSSVDEYYKALTRYISMSNDEIMAMKKKCIDSFNPYNITTIANLYLEVYKA